MRTTSFFTIVLAAVALGALLVVRARDRGRAPAVRAGTVTLIGDSLNLGVEPYLAAALPGWKLVTNDQVGRSSAVGVAELEAGRPPLSAHVVVSLGTNDAPSDTEGFRTDVHRVLALAGERRCIAWATIWRDGAPSDAFNAVLREAAAANRRLVLVEWAKMVQENPDLLAPDGLHGNADGYRARAKATAEAVKACAPEQTVGEG